MEIEYDARKAQSNKAKHGVGFDEAASALLDPQALAMEDKRAEGEARWVLKKQSTMRKHYDLSKAKRAKDVSHLKKLQAEAKGKSRITIMLDNDILSVFRARAEEEGIGYQTLINQTLREALGSRPVDEATLRKVLREELQS